MEEVEEGGLGGEGDTGGEAGADRRVSLNGSNSRRSRRATTRARTGTPRTACYLGNEVKEIDDLGREYTRRYPGLDPAED